MIKELKGKKRILIVGGCGAGKTTLALRLGSELNLGFWTATICGHWERD